MHSIQAFLIWYLCWWVHIVLTRAHWYSTLSHIDIVLGGAYGSDMDGDVNLSWSLWASLCIQSSGVDIQVKPLLSLFYIDKVAHHGWKVWSASYLVPYTPLLYTWNLGSHMYLPGSYNTLDSKAMEFVRTSLPKYLPIVECVHIYAC